MLNNLWMSVFLLINLLVFIGINVILIDLGGNKSSNYKKRSQYNFRTQKITKREREESNEHFLEWMQRNG